MYKILDENATQAMEVTGTPRGRLEVEGPGEDFKTNMLSMLATGISGDLEQVAEDTVYGVCNDPGHA